MPSYRARAGQSRIACDFIGLYVFSKIAQGVGGLSRGSTMLRSSPAGVFLEFAALGAPGAAGGRHVVSGVGKRCKHRFDVVEHVCPKHQEGCICCVLVIEGIVVTWGLGLHEVTGCAEYIAQG